MLMPARTIEFEATMTARQMAKRTVQLIESEAVGRPVDRRYVAKLRRCAARWFATAHGPEFGSHNPVFVSLSELMDGQRRYTCLSSLMSLADGEPVRWIA